MTALRTKQLLNQEVAQGVQSACSHAKSQVQRGQFLPSNLYSTTTDRRHMGCLLSEMKLQCLLVGRPRLIFLTRSTSHGGA